MPVDMSKAIPEQYKSLYKKQGEKHAEEQRSLEEEDPELAAWAAQQGLRHESVKEPVEPKKLSDEQRRLLEEANRLDGVEAPSHEEQPISTEDRRRLLEEANGLDDKAADHEFNEQNLKKGLLALEQRVAAGDTAAIKQLHEIHDSQLQKEMRALEAADPDLKAFGDKLRAAQKVAKSSMSESPRTEDSASDRFSAGSSASLPRSESSKTVSVMSGRLSESSSASSPLSVSGEAAEVRGFLENPKKTKVSFGQQLAGGLGSQASGRSAANPKGRTSQTR